MLKIPTKVIPLILFLLLILQNSESFIHPLIASSLKNKLALKFDNLLQRNNITNISSLSILPSLSKINEYNTSKNETQNKSSAKGKEDTAIPLRRLSVQELENQAIMQRSMSTNQEFPYNYELIPLISNRMGVAEHRQPYSNIVIPVPVSEDRDDSHDDHGFSPMVNHINTRPVPATHFLNQRPPHHAPQQQSGLFPQLTKTEIDFVGILAAIGLKLIMSTALASWFLVAGQSLYSIAAFTGTVAVFGQDSTIGYIYKTLPFVEALLRGETTFF